MPVVFVHGVNVREGRAYSVEVLQRNRYLSNIFLKTLGRDIAPDAIHCPYWGDLATQVTPGKPFLPAFETPTSTTKRLLNQLVAADDAKDEKLSLLNLARKESMDDVVDLLIAAAAEEETSSEADAEQLCDFAYNALKFTKQFKSFDDQLEWLEGIDDDAQLLGKLEEEINNAGAKSKFKGMPRVRKAVSWMQNHWMERRQAIKADISSFNQKALDRAKNDIQRAKDDLAKLKTTAGRSVKTIANARRRTTTHLTAAMITHPIRKIVHDRMFFFIGDAFLYFGHRGTPQSPGPIVKRIVDTMHSARQQIDPVHDPELIVISHSMGGNIACDVLSYFATDLPVDLMITVGSQFPLFADLHMFPGLDTHNHPIPKPANIKRWINIYDVNDVFGFAAHPMFSGIEDVEFTSGRFGVATHADCFKFVSLYERMAQAVLQPDR